MQLVGQVLVWVLLAFQLLLLFRLVMEYVFLFAKRFRPTGVLAALLEVTYSITDPPLRALRRVLPPLRLGGVSLDLAFLVLFILVVVLLEVVRSAFNV